MHSIRMTLKELQRAETIHLVEIGNLTRNGAAERLGITTRQVDRLRNKLRMAGSCGLAHGSRGRKSNNRLPEGREKELLELIREHYSDFGPTFAAEKLYKNHQIKVSKEKLRQLMKENGLWRARKRKEKKYHPRRQRRSHFGDMLQGDGSEHDWFEGRRERCSLVALIDDATNRGYGQFFESETTEAYVEVMKEYLKKYGRPRTLYVDKDSIFRINRPLINIEKAETQFARMMKELDIQLICAHSPEAKGRVERLFGILQDRLVKEMRLLNITTIDDANKYLEKVFWNDYNNRWAHAPEKPEDFHRYVPSDVTMEKIFTLRYKRKVSKSLDFSYEGTLYQIQTEIPHKIAQKPVMIFQRFDGTFWVEFEGKHVEAKPFKTIPQSTPIADAKTINSFINKRKQITAIERHRRGISCLR